MAEVAKPDYLSLVNKGGSGFNVSELVTSIVAAEIEPKRSRSIKQSKSTDRECNFRNCFAERKSLIDLR